MPTNMFRILNQDVWGGGTPNLHGKEKNVYRIVVKQLEERTALKTTGQK
jgi:hypothetical protein